MLQITDELVQEYLKQTQPEILKERTDEEVSTAWKRIKCYIEFGKGDHKKTLELAMTNINEELKNRAESRTKSKRIVDERE